MINHPGNITDLFALREIEANCLCLLTEKPHQREYKAVLTIHPVNFSLLSEREQESILESFRVFLARIPTHQPLMIHIRIEPYNLQPYLDQLHHPTQTPSPMVQAMAEDHEQFVLTLASQRALLQRRFYIIVGAEREKGRGHDQIEIFDRAKSTLDLKCKEILQDMERCGLTGYRLDNTALKDYYHSCLHSACAKAYPIPSSNIEATKRPLVTTETHAREVPNTKPVSLDRDMLSLAAKTMVSTKKVKSTRTKNKKLPSNTSLAELLAPSSIEVDRNYLRIHHHTDEYIRGLAIIGYPATVTAGWLDRLIQIDEPQIDIVMHIEPLDNAAYTAKLSRKLTGFHATQLLEARHGRTPDPWIKAAKVQVEGLREKLVAQTEKVFGLSLYLLVRADRRDHLKERTNKLLSLLKSLELTAVECSFEHVKVWQCCLPDGRDTLKRSKPLDTSSLITAFPFASSSLSTPTGILIGVMPNGSLVIIDPKSDLFENGHEVKFARSGAGKSYDEKVRIARAILAGYKAIVIDPEGEYAPLCKLFGGTTIPLSSGSLHMNPFDLPIIPDKGNRNVLEEKYQNLHTLFDLLLAEKIPGTLSQREKTYLNKCFARVYAEQGITNDLATHTKPAPSMKDLYAIISSQMCGPDTFELADRLERYIAAFPQQTTVGLNEQLIAFNIRDLDDDLKAVGLFLITDFVWTQVRREIQPQPRLLVIDEAWTLMQFAEGGRFLAEVSRRARKYHLCLRTITQDVEDFLGSEWGRTILVNSAMKFLMKQDSSTIDSVTKAFRLSEGERKYLLTCQKGEGLFFAQSSHVAMRVVASPLEHQVATTNPQELLQRTEDHA